MNTKDKALKILVCDDDPQDIILLRHYLKMIPGKEIVLLEAERTNEIRDALKKGRIDLVFMDLQMPGKSGKQWLGEIVGKQLAPVIILTGSGNEEIAVESLQNGAIDYLPKSNLSLEKVYNAIDGALDKWKEHLLLKGDLDELDKIINKDELTGVLSRSAIMKRIDEAIKYARRYGEGFASIMLDIDNFKYINDEYGHLIGDDVLEKIGNTLQRELRETDFTGRYGGDEFIIILPKADLDIALELASRINKTISNTKLKDAEDHYFKVTASLGLSIYMPGDNKRSLIDRADKALRIAKVSGRNKVRIDRTITL